MRLARDTATILRSYGLNVVEIGGWETRGKEMARIDAIVCHHTASSPKANNEAVRKLLVLGRSDLPGPLSQFGLERDGTVVLIAAGRSNHNGYGTFGNNSLGIEAYNDGIGESWPQRQLDAYVKLAAALCEITGVPVSNVQGHRETDPRRKIDPTGIDMDEFRRKVAAELSEEDEMTDEEKDRLKNIESQVEQIVKGLGIRPGMEGMSNRKLSTNALGRIDWMFEAARDGDDDGPIDLDALLDRIAERLSQS